MADDSPNLLVKSVLAAAPPTPFRLLIAHEQHLQPMGCDVRLLGIIRTLLSMGVEVSLFFRTHTLVSKRSPPSAEVARLLHIPRD